MIEIEEVVETSTIPKRSKNIMRKLYEIIELAYASTPLIPCFGSKSRTSGDFCSEKDI